MVRPNIDNLKSKRLILNVRRICAGPSLPAPLRMEITKEGGECRQLTNILNASIGAGDVVADRLKEFALACQLCRRRA